jgi:hypothetical protein
MVAIAASAIELSRIEDEWREVRPFAGVSDGTVDMIMRNVQRGIDVVGILERSVGYDESYDDSVLLAVMKTIDEFRATSSRAPLVLDADWESKFETVAFACHFEGYDVGRHLLGTSHQVLAHSRSDSDVVEFSEAMRQRIQEWGIAELTEGLVALGVAKALHANASWWASQSSWRELGGAAAETLALMSIVGLGFALAQHDLLIATANSSLSGRTSTTTDGSPRAGNPLHAAGPARDELSGCVQHRGPGRSANGDDPWG